MLYLMQKKQLLSGFTFIILIFQKKHDLSLKFLIWFSVH